MRRVLLTLALVITVSATTAPALADDFVLMKVNDQEVSKDEVDRMWAGLFPTGQAPVLDSMDATMRDKILRGMMTERLLLQAALKDGIDTTEPFKRELEDIRKKLVVRHFLEAKTADITDADLKGAYEALVLELRDARELRARHILLESEKLAREVKKKLDAGKNFDALAREYSKDPGSAKQGGDLGYFTREKMVKEFADAAFAMKKGAISAPVQSQFGWHIIKLEDSRPVTIPTFQAVKEQLRTQAQEKKLAAYIQELVNAATVTVYDAKGKEQPFNKAIADEKSTKR